MGLNPVREESLDRRKGTCSSHLQSSLFFGTSLAYGLEPSFVVGLCLNTTMHIRFFAFLFSISLCISSLQAQNASPPPTVDQLVAKNIEAKGGAPAISAMKSLRLTGKLLLNNGQL